MLTRLKVTGFKNLVDVDVRFGPFTCTAGANGVGKSNLFDAIRFLSALAEKPLTEAALSVRGEGGRLSDIRGLFHHSGNDYAPTMSFEAEMIIPASGTDRLGQPFKAEATFLRYKLTLGYRENQHHVEYILDVLDEELIPMPADEIPGSLLFPQDGEAWRESILVEERTTPFIRTVTKNGKQSFLWYSTADKTAAFAFHADDQMSRTLLSRVGTRQDQTFDLARQEMLSWRALNMEPSALRKPDELTARPQLGADGSHLAATLYRIAQDYATQNSEKDTSSIYAQISNRLWELTDEIRGVYVDRDEGRELFTLQVTGRDKTVLPARALSDGTLRFLALTTLLFDPEAQGVICLEEPENGIHPARIPALLRLLRDIATDVSYPVGPDNPLRQVIINTHSPVVVQQVPDDSLLIAEARETIKDGKRLTGVAFSALPDTWRSNALEGVRVISRGALLAYLNSSPLSQEAPFAIEPENGNGIAAESRRIIDRPDFQTLLPHGKPAE